MYNKTNIRAIGVDLGATNIRGAVVSGNTLANTVSVRVHNNGTVEDVLGDIYQVIDALMDEDVAAIGIGVPSVVDVAEGIVYDVQHIPSWVKVPLKQLLEARYRKPVFINNDANCFALGEYYFGKGRDTDSMIGMTLGTGLGSGIIINGKLFAGYNCGAGEFGMLPYKDQVLEYYASGSFFKNVYQLDGVQVFKAAQQGDARALELYAELGTHFGQAIKMVMYGYDPQLIVLGGSVAQAYPLFAGTMWREIRTFAYAKSAERIQIAVSDLQNSGLLGAAALYFNAQEFSAY